MAGEAKANSVSKPRWVRYINPVNWVTKSARFVRDSFKEIKRITWPDKDKLIRSTLVVVVTVVFITLFIWGADSIFRAGLSGFLKLLQ